MYFSHNLRIFSTGGELLLNVMTNFPLLYSIFLMMTEIFGQEFDILNRNYLVQ